MTWLNRLFNRASTKQSRSVAGLDNWIAGPSMAGVTVTHDTALTLTSVYACVNVIASSIASMPYVVYRRQADGGRIPDPSYHLYDILQFEPNPETDAYTFWTDFTGQAVLTGNSYAEIIRDSDGSALALWQLDGQTTTPVRDSDGRLAYRVDGGRDGRNITRHLLAEDVLHLRTISGNGNGVLGSSPIMLARNLIGTAIAAQTSAASVFRNASTPLGYLTSPGTLDDVERKNVREYFNREHQGVTNTGKIGILEEGTTFTPIKVDLQSLQYNESQLTHAKMVAQLFGVPNHKIGILDDATYSNIEEMDLDFYKSTLRLWCERIESQVNTKLISRADRKIWTAEHNMNAIVRGNLTSQTDHLVKAFGVGAYSVNQVCQNLGINPIGPEGDQRYTLNNFVPLGQPAQSVNPVQLPEIADLGDNPPEVDRRRALEPEAPKTSPEALEAVRSLLVAEIGRLCRREQQAVGRLVKRSADLGDIARYYSDHQIIVTEAITPVATAYRSLGGTLDVSGLIAELSTTSGDLTAKEVEIINGIKEGQ